VDIYGGIKWAPDSQHFAILGRESNGTAGEYYAYVFDLAGSLVDQQPAWDLAWVDASTFIVLPVDNATSTRSLVAYIAHLGSKDLQPITGRYGHLLGDGHGSVALWDDLGTDPYMIWSSGALHRGVLGLPLAWSADGKLLAIESRSEIKVVQAQTGAVVRDWTGVVVGAHDTASFNPDGRYLELETDRAVVLEISTGKTLAVLSRVDPMHEGTIGDIRVQWLATDRLFVDDPANGGAFWSVSVGGSRQPVQGVKYSLGWALATEGTLAVAQDSGPDLDLYHEKTITIVKAQGQTMDVQLPFAPWTMTWSPTGQELVVTSETGLILLVDLDS
jgi:hypothetical protein